MASLPMRQSKSPVSCGSRDLSASDYPRDMRGYEPNPPNVSWPGGARIAVQFVVNYEEGGERCILHGDETGGLLSGCSADPWEGRRHLNMSRVNTEWVGAWRLLRMFDSRGLPFTVFTVRMAERNQSLSVRCVTQGMRLQPWLSVDRL